MSPQAPREGEEARWSAYTPYADQRVLRNIPGIEDHAKWQRAEYKLAEINGQKILDGRISIPHTFDAQHAAAVHKALFDGFYDWAGQMRTVNMHKTPLGMPERLWFADYESIEAQLDRAGQYFKDFLNNPGDRRQFVEAASRGMALWNYAHPFREANGRTTKIILSQFAEGTPWQFEFRRVTPDQWNQASMLSMPARDTQMRPQPQNLLGVFNAITVDRQPTITPGRQDPDRLSQLGISKDEYKEIRARLAGNHRDSVKPTGRDASPRSGDTDQIQQRPEQKGEYKPQRGQQPPTRGRGGPQR